MSCTAKFITYKSIGSDFFKFGRNLIDRSRYSHHIYSFFVDMETMYHIFDVK